LLGREDLDGLTGHDSGVDGCGNPRAAPPLGFWMGYTSYPAAYLGSRDLGTLKANRFINVQRFGR
jgi:hypothetical protein